MFVLRTGLQGHSKTLNTIIELDKKSKRENRAVYYHNITNFKPDSPVLEGTWIPFDDPLTWYELPNDAIIVIDEAQTFFRVRPQGSQVPLYASRLEIMRKQGHELHCITQEPTLIDAHFRKLCNSHIHYNRPFKGRVIYRWEFERPVDVQKPATWSTLGQSTQLTLNSKYFDVYQSAQAAHHFQFRPPKALFVLIAALSVIGISAYNLSDRIFAEPATADKTVDPQSTDVAPAAAPGPILPTLESYLQQRTPLVPDIASSAPIYQALTQPVTFPKPSCLSTTDADLLTRAARLMAVQMHDGKLTGCRCNSQQGTRMQVSFEYCMTVVDNGYFDDTKPDNTQAGDRGAGARGTRGRPGAGGCSCCWFTSDRGQ